MTKQPVCPVTTLKYINTCSTPHGELTACICNSTGNTSLSSIVYDLPLHQILNNLHSTDCV